MVRVPVWIWTGPLTVRVPPPIPTGSGTEIVREETVWLPLRLVAEEFVEPVAEKTV